MDTIKKSYFMMLLKYRPLSLIGRKIMFLGTTQIIYDISLSGDSMLMDRDSQGKEWYHAGSLDNPVIIDCLPNDAYSHWNAGEGCTVLSVFKTDKNNLSKPSGDSHINQFTTVRKEFGTIFQKTLDLVWTDGGNPANDAHFDGAGEFGSVLEKMFAGDSRAHPLDGQRGVPIMSDIMSDIIIGSKVKCTIRIEIEQKARIR